MIVGYHKIGETKYRFETKRNVKPFLPFLYEREFEYKLPSGETEKRACAVDSKAFLWVLKEHSMKLVSETDFRNYDPNFNESKRQEILTQYKNSHPLDTEAFKDFTSVLFEKLKELKEETGININLNTYNENGEIIDDFHTDGFEEFSVPSVPSNRKNTEYIDDVFKMVYINDLSIQKDRNGDTYLRVAYDVSSYQSIRLAIEEDGSMRVANFLETISGFERKTPWIRNINFADVEHEIYYKINCIEYWEAYYDQDFVERVKDSPGGFGSYDFSEEQILDRFYNAVTYMYTNHAIMKGLVNEEDGDEAEKTMIQYIKKIFESGEKVTAVLFVNEQFMYNSPSFHLIPPDIVAQILSHYRNYPIIPIAFWFNEL